MVNWPMNTAMPYSEQAFKTLALHSLPMTRSNWLTTAVGLLRQRHSLPQQTGGRQPGQFCHRRCYFYMAM